MHPTIRAPRCSPRLASAPRPRLGDDRGGVGYRLTLGREEIDLTRFQDLVAAARREDDPERAAALARAALDLWTADPWVPDDFDWARRDLLEDRAHAQRIAGPHGAPTVGAVDDTRIPAALTPLIGRADEIALAELS
jgi:hypothetical protein